MFEFDDNLDDEEEIERFIEVHGTNKGRSLANALGFQGEGAHAAANALSGYAWNRRTAMRCRKRGQIETAIKYEDICDRIYKEDINGKIKCW